MTVQVSEHSGFVAQIQPGLVVVEHSGFVALVADTEVIDLPDSGHLGIYHGAGRIGAIYHGSTAIARVYKGSNLMFG